MTKTAFRPCREAQGMEMQCRVADCVHVLTWEYAPKEQRCACCQAAGREVDPTKKNNR